MENYKLVDSLEDDSFHEERGTTTVNTVPYPSTKVAASSTSTSPRKTQMKAIYDAATEEERELALRYAEDLLRAFEARSQQGQSPISSAAVAAHNQSDVNMSTTSSVASRGSSSRHNPFSLSSARVERLKQQHTTTTLALSETNHTSQEDHEVSITYGKNSGRGFITPPRMRPPTQLLSPTSVPPSAIQTPLKETGINVSVHAPIAARDEDSALIVPSNNAAICSTLSSVFYSSPQLAELRQRYFDAVVSSSESVFNTLLHEVPKDHILLTMLAGNAAGGQQSTHQQPSHILSPAVRNDTAWSRVGECVREHLYSLQSHKLHALHADLAQANTTIQSLQQQLRDAKEIESGGTVSDDAEIAALRSKLAEATRQTSNSEARYAQMTESAQSERTALRKIVSAQSEHMDAMVMLCSEEQTSFTDILLGHLKGITAFQDTLQVAAPVVHEDTLLPDEKSLNRSEVDQLDASFESDGHFVPHPPPSPSPRLRREEREGHDRRVLLAEESLRRQEVESGYVDEVSNLLAAQLHIWAKLAVDLHAGSTHLHDEVNELSKMIQTQENDFKSYAGELQSQCSLLNEKSDALEAALTSTQSLLDNAIAARHSDASRSASLFSDILVEEETRYRTMFEAVSIMHLTTLAMLMADTLMLSYSIEGSAEEKVWAVRQEIEANQSSSELRHSMLLESAVRTARVEENSRVSARARDHVVDLEDSLRSLLADTGMGALASLYSAVGASCDLEMASRTSWEVALKRQQAAHFQTSELVGSEAQSRLQIVYAESLDRSELSTVLAAHIDALLVTEKMQVHLSTLAQEQALRLDQQRIALVEGHHQELAAARADLMERFGRREEALCTNARIVARATASVESLEQRWRSAIVDDFMAGEFYLLAIKHEDYLSLTTKQLELTHEVETRRAVEEVVSRCSHDARAEAELHLHRLLQEQLEGFEAKLADIKASISETLFQQAQQHDDEVRALRDSLASFTAVASKERNDVLSRTPPQPEVQPPAIHNSVVCDVIATNARLLSECHYKSCELALLTSKIDISAVAASRERELRDQYAAELAEFLRISESEHADAVEREADAVGMLERTNALLGNAEREHKRETYEKNGMILRLQSELREINDALSKAQAETERLTALYHGAVSFLGRMSSEVAATVVLREPQERLFVEHGESALFELLAAMELDQRRQIRNDDLHRKRNEAEQTRTERVVAAVEERLASLLPQQPYQASSAASLLDVEGAFLNILERVLIGNERHPADDGLTIATPDHMDHPPIQGALVQSLSAPILRHLTSLLNATPLSSPAGEQSSNHTAMLLQLTAKVNELSTLLERSPIGVRSALQIEESKSEELAAVQHLKSENGELRHKLDLQAIDRESARALLRSLLSWVGGAESRQSIEDGGGLFEVCEALTDALRQCTLHRKGNASQTESAAERHSFLLGKVSVLAKDILQYKASLASLRHSVIQQIERAEIITRSTIAERIASFESSWRQGTLAELEEFARRLSDDVESAVKNVFARENGDLLVAYFDEDEACDEGTPDRDTLAAPRSLVRPLLAMIAKDVHRALLTTLDGELTELLTDKAHLENEVLSMRDQLRDAQAEKDFSTQRLEGLVEERAEALERCVGELSTVRAQLTQNAVSLAELRTKYAVESENWSHKSADSDSRFTTRLNELQGEIRALEGTKDTLLVEIRRITSERDVLEGNINTHWKPTVDELSSKCESLAHECNTLKRDATDEVAMRILLEKRVDDLEKEATEASNEYEAERIRMAASHKEAIEAIRERSADDAAAQTQRLTERIELLNQRHDQLVRERRDSEAILRDSIASLKANASDEAAAAERRLQEMRDELRMEDGAALLLLQRERDEYVKDLKSHHEREASDLRSQIEALERRILSLGHSHDELVIMYQDAKQELQGIRAGDLLHAHHEVTHLQSKVGELQEALDIERAQVSSLQTILGTTQEELHETQSTARSIKQTLGECQRTIGDLRGREAEARESLAESEATIGRLTTEIEQYKRTLHLTELDALETASEMQALRSKLQIAISERDRHQETAYDVSRQLMEVRREHQSITDDLRSRVAALTRSLLEEERRNGDLHRRAVDDQERRMLISGGSATNNFAATSSLVRDTGSRMRTSTFSPPVHSGRSFEVDTPQALAGTRASGEGGRYAALANSIRAEREQSVNSAKRQASILRPSLSPIGALGSLRGSALSSIKKPDHSFGEASPQPSAPSPNLEKNAVMLEYSPTSQERAEASALMNTRKGGQRAASPSLTESSCGPSYSPARVEAS